VFLFKYSDDLNNQFKEKKIEEKNILGKFCVCT